MRLSKPADVYGMSLGTSPPKFWLWPFAAHHLALVLATRLYRYAAGVEASIAAR